MWSLPSRPLVVGIFVTLALVAQTSRISGSSPQSLCQSSSVPQVRPPSIHTPPDVNLLGNGDFSNGMACWLAFATPDPSYVVARTNNGALEFYREPQPAGERSNQAVVFQWTATPLWDGAPIVARFDLGNSSSVRKRIAVLVHESDFSDLFACTFWLEPNAPLRTYTMRTHTTRVWWNTTVAFYAASAGSEGGFYQVDNVSLMYAPAEPADRTVCEDPSAPAPTGGPDGPTLLVNGAFSAGLAPWATFHRLTSQLTNGVFEFIWPPPEFAENNPPIIPQLEPAPVVIQATGVPIAAGEILTAQFDLGNSSTVRKRVSVLIHQRDFADLAACTFWLEPNAPLRTYTMRMFATADWSDAAFSVYAATRGPEQWIQLDNAVLWRTPSTATAGTECYEPSQIANLALRLRKP
jgi:hypothetical protein